MMLECRFKYGYDKKGDATVVVEIPIFNFRAKCEEKRLVGRVDLNFHTICCSYDPKEIFPKLD